MDDAFQDAFEPVPVEDGMDTGPDEAVEAAYREAFLADVAAFIQEVTVDAGTQRDVKRLSDRSKYRWVVSDFHGFDLAYRKGMSTIYGQDFSAVYEGRAVLDLHRDAPGEPMQVEAYNEGDWERAIYDLMQDPAAAVAAYEEEQ